jgi:LysM repeat protein
MVARFARFAAPIALAVVVLGTYLIVHGGLATHHQNMVHSTPDLTTARGGGRRLARRAKVYVVRSGDTLSSISAQTHVSIQRLLSLNPSVSPNALQTGQRLRLRQ